MKAYSWRVYAVAAAVAAISFWLAYVFSENGWVSAVAALPGASALASALVQIFRDDAAFKRSQLLLNESNDFILSAMSHMANVAFDKHVEFTETYLQEAERGLSELFRAGPSKQALELAGQLYKVRTDFSAWVTKEIRNELEPFEQALRKIGAQSDLLEHIPAGQERSQLVQDLYDTYTKVAGVKEPGEKEVAAKEEAARLKECFQEFLGVHELTLLRNRFVGEAVRRCDRKSPFLQVLCLLFVAGASLPGRADTNAVAQANRIRSQAIASWLTNVTTTTITRTGDVTTAVTEYRSNAVSQAEFAATKVKAERGDAVAQYQLGQLYGWLVGGSANAAEGKEWIRKAAEQGLPEAQLEIGWSYYKKDSVEALRWFRKAADQGHPEAQRIVGQCYSIGEGVAANDCEALSWYRKAAEGDSLEAQKNLAVFYSNGIGVPKDATKAAYWYRQAAEQGDADAGYWLGRAYAKGRGVETNIIEAVKWYRKAAEQDHVEAQSELAFLFIWSNTGKIASVAESYEEGVKWARKAADKGDAQAQNLLASAYREGLGVQRDYAAALRWCRLAADQGNAHAQRDLGVTYFNGEGVPKNANEAAKWFRKAAEQGHFLAQQSLGELYQAGDGVPQDYVEAYKWLNIAAAQGWSDAANRRDRLAHKMTPVQVSEGQRRSAEFVALKEGGGPKKTDTPNAGVLNGEPRLTGRAFFTAIDGFLVSNAHVVESAAQVRLVTTTGLTSAKVIKVDAANDMALLKAEGRFAALPVAASRSVKLGATVATVGFPNIGLQGFAPKLAKGEIASLSGPQDDARYFQISVPVQPGNSGGALVDERGNVVGVVSAKLSAAAALKTSGALPENVNYAIKSSYLLSFLESVPEVSAKLKEPNTKERKSEDVVKDAEQAAVLVLVY